MTKEEREKVIDALKISAPIHALTEEEFNDYIQTLNKAMDWLEQEPKTDSWSIKDVADTFKKHGLIVEQEPCEDAISRAEAVRVASGYCHPANVAKELANLPPVNPTKTGHCKDCKWWKDSDGTYCRGIHAESKCPINRKEVYEGNGYCYMFEPQES